MKIGIDLGTSYSSVAAEVNGKIEMIRIATGAGAFGDSYSIPTAAYVDNGRMLLGQAALNKRKLSPFCFKSEFKRDLGTTTPFLLGEEEYLPEQLYTEFFLYFKNQAMEQMGEKIEKAYITHPANYGNNKKRLVEKAANNAGLLDVVLVDEPTAAAAGYSQKSRINEGDIVLVYDLGGGTFDVAIIKKTANSYVHLTEPLGISMCGGVDFDRAIFDDIMEKLSKSGQFDMDRLMKEKRFTAALSEVSIQIKHQLSQAQSHTEPIAVGFDYFDYTITRQEFEGMIRPFVVNTCEKVKDILKNSGLVSTDIDRVLLVGGSSRVPLVRKMVQETLKMDISLDADPELAVCQGAVSLVLMKREDVQVKKRDQDEWKDIQDKKGMQDKKKEENIQSQEIEEESFDPMEYIIRDVIFGISAYDGEWIYYMSTESDGSALYKIKTDGTQETRLSSYNSNNASEFRVEVDGKWVYYQADLDENFNSNFYRVRKDGTGETRISKGDVPKGNCHEYTVKGGRIYFVNPVHDDALYMMTMDGTYITQLGKDRNVVTITMNDEWIYYSRYSDDNTKISLCKVSTDGLKRATLHSLKDSGSRETLFMGISVFDDWIYYWIDITEKEPSGEISRSEIWKIYADGSGNSRVLVDYNRMLNFNIVGGRLYYNIYRDDDVHMYRMNLDGTGTMRAGIKMLRQDMKNIKIQNRKINARG